MKYTLWMISVAAVALLMLASCSTSEKGVSSAVPAATGDSSTSLSEADLGLGVDDLSDLEELDAENQAMFSDAELADLATE